MWKGGNGTGVVIAVLVMGALVLGLTGGTSAYFSSRQVTGPHGLYTWQCIPWIQTTQADFQSDIAVNVSTIAIPGSVILGNQTITVGSGTADSPFVYGISGNSGPAFSMYNISNKTWVPLAGVPNNVQAGGALATGEAGNIYASDGTTSGKFLWRYTIASNSWTKMSNIPGSDKIASGGALASNGTGFIFALMGGGSTSFLRYAVFPTDSWTTMAPAPGAVNAGGALAYTNNGNISAFQGGTTAFWRYNTTTNAWTTMAPAPGLVGAGGALTYARNDNIYAFNGSGTTTFWRYNIPTNTWTTMAPAPGSVNAGGSLMYTSVNGNISAFQGSAGAGSTAFWQYNITSNSWSAFANVPAAVGVGGSLAYPPGSASQSISVFVPNGNLTSVVNNSGKSGTIWNSLVWSGTTPSNIINITFNVRARDAPFGPTDTSPSWVSVGWFSPVTTSLPAGQYFQWQANLTTTDNTKTPRLDDVSLCYT